MKVRHLTTRTAPPVFLPTAPTTRPLILRQGPHTLYEEDSSGTLARTTSPSSSPPLVDHMQHLMPRDYSTSTLPSYPAYVRASMVSSAFGTAASVLSMQALLTSVVGINAALPLAATLNWVLKDGLGQLGGVLFAAKINTKFDADPKRFRLAADWILAMAVVLECCTALVPGLFLPIASVANVGKNVAWLSASATRASIHQSFCKENNLGDVTGKAGSQTIAASIVGTALGILISPVVAEDPTSLVLGCTALCVVHVSASFAAVRAVTLKTLNVQRAWLSLVPTLVGYRTVGGLQSSLVALDWEKLDIPENVSNQEQIVHFGRWGGRNGKAHLFSPLAAVTKTTLVAATIATTTTETTNPPIEEEGISFKDAFLSFIRPRPFLTASLHVNPTLDDFCSDANDLKVCFGICERYEDKHLIRVLHLAENKFVVKLLYLDNATNVDILAGFLHAVLVARAVSRLGSRLAFSSTATTSGRAFDKLVMDVRDRMFREDACSKFQYGLEDKGWNVEHLFLEEDGGRGRIKLMN